MRLGRVRIDMATKGVKGEDTHHMTDRSRRRAAPSESDDGAVEERNPFAAPPEGRPDQPWRPRRPSPMASHGSSSQMWRGHGHAGDGQESGDGGEGNGDGAQGSEGSGDSDERPSTWGSQWSSRQPGRHSGGFGQGGPENGGPGGDGGPGGPGGPGRPGMRWDPTDPLQRHARYSLHTGIWALFFALFSLPPVALLLGALSLYWGIHSLRGKGGKGSGGKGGGRSGARATAEDVAGTDRTAGTEGRVPTALQTQVQVNVSPEQAERSKRTAAVGGLVLAGLAILVVAAGFALQMVYSDYYACTQDALTQSSRADCKNLLPSELRPFLENR